MEQEYTGPGLALDAENMEILQAGMDFHDLQKTPGYRRVMKFLKARSDMALKTMRDAPIGDDKIRLEMLLQWQFCEDVIDAIDDHIDQAMRLAQSTIKDLNVNELAREGFAIRFGNDDETE